MMMFVVTGLLVRPLFADSPQRQEEQVKTVFVTGSLIPIRVKVRRIGTNTVSPVRVIDRQEIEQTGRHTTSGVLINDPSVRVIGR